MIRKDPLVFQFQPICALSILWCDKRSALGLNAGHLSYYAGVFTCIGRVCGLNLAISASCWLPTHKNSIGRDMCGMTPHISVTSITSFVDCLGFAALRSMSDKPFNERDILSCETKAPHAVSLNRLLSREEACCLVCCGEAERHAAACSPPPIPWDGCGGPRCLDSESPFISGLRLQG